MTGRCAGCRVTGFLPMRNNMVLIDFVDMKTFSVHISDCMSMKRKLIMTTVSWCPIILYYIIIIIIIIIILHINII